MGNLQGVADLLVAQVLLRVEQDRLSVVRRDPLDQIGEPTSPLGVDHVRDDAIIEGYVGGTVLVQDTTQGLVALLVRAKVLQNRLAAMPYSQGRAFGRVRS